MLSGSEFMIKMWCQQGSKQEGAKEQVGLNRLYQRCAIPASDKSCAYDAFRYLSKETRLVAAGSPGEGWGPEPPNGSGGWGAPAARRRGLRG
ncbi:MAG: hypothetical protein DCC55_24190 [Chloroflexi bacterium]|nr:MAG: hypothetical protein DCC55_24190 [Chloroflexota bacterium]